MTTSKTILSRILFVVYITAVAFLCFSTSESLPTLDKTFLGIPVDKVAHFLMFLPYPLLTFLSFDHKSKKKWASVGFVFLTFASGVLLAGLTEYIQKFIPTRAMDVADFNADCIAILISSILVLIVDLSRCK